jgi:uncharacterized SAM-binding protein YcdF (DUF218 family)
MALLLGMLGRKLLALLVIIGVALWLLMWVIPWYLGPTSTLQFSDAIVAISGGDTGARTQEAINLYKAGWSSHLIFSGAAKDPSGPSNAEVMRQQAMSEGVPSGNIEVEQLAQDTVENAQETANILHSKGYTSIILVTSPYHQRRAYFDFHHLLGNTVTIINQPSTNNDDWPGRTWWLHPNSLVIGFGELARTLYTSVTDRIV